MENRASSVDRTGPETGVHSGSVDSPFRLGLSDIHGNGVFSTSDIPATTRLYEVFWLTAKGQEVQKNGGNPLWPAGVGVGDWTVYFNHQKEANCRTEVEDDIWYLVSIVDIARDVELTVDYRRFPIFMDRRVDGYFER